MKKIFIVAGFFYSLIANTICAQEPVTHYMVTPWTKKVQKTKPLNDYPRPAMVRKNWQNLNGIWKYAIADKNTNIPTNWEGNITVPFPMESFLSGVQKRITKEKCIWYQKAILQSKPAAGQKVLLHIGASDWETKIFVNRKLVTTHQGGFTPVSVDITEFLNNKNNILNISVWDPTDEGEQERGKQVSKPEGIYYTSVTGIWQTVWLEKVNITYIKDYKVNTNIDQSTVQISPAIENIKQGDVCEVSVFEKGKFLFRKNFAANEKSFSFPVPSAKLWTPESPNLYDFQVKVIRNKKIIDEVSGYFGMRKVEVKKDAAGVDRLFLNNKAIFMYGPLDQGYWPDGIYTAPTEEALVSDIKSMKAMGFNMVRKHVKVEPQRWYYHCDKLGLLVWQDMPSGYKEIVPVKDHDHSIEMSWMNDNYKDLERSETSEKQFRSSWQEIIASLYNHPSIVMWVPFNESWGQFKTNEILKWTKHLDATRIVAGPSGWIDRGFGETRDYHLYSDRLDKDFPLEDGRALVIGEFGGLGYVDSLHKFKKDSWSYNSYKTPAELLSAYKKLLERIKVMKQKGFSAAVYTQLTDVETEVNGIITYDRFGFKITPEKLKEIHKELYK